MKRLIITLGLVLLLALAACDTMGPTTQEVLPTDAAQGTTDAAPPVAEATEPGVTGETAEGTTTEAGADLQGVTWEWVSQLDPMGQTTAVDPTRYTIAFNADGTANIKADCNSVTATYLTDGVNLTIQPGASTAVACPEDTQDQLFLSSLAAAESYVVQDSELFITMRGGSGTIIFRSAAGDAAGPSGEPAEPALTGVIWEWVSTTTSAEEIVVADPTRYNIVFNEDGTAGIKADCNVGNAEYTTGEDGSLSITLGVSTMAFCVDSQDQLFRDGLAAASLYNFDGGDLYIDMTADGGTMRFRNAGTAGAEAPAGEANTLTGVTWEWIESVTMLGATAVADPTRYTILFNEDGTANIKADCNNVLATYTTDGENLSLTLGPSTLMACPPDSQVNEFMAGLQALSLGAYMFDGADLVLRNLAADGGTMRFRNAGTVGAEAPAGEAGALTGVTWEWIESVTMLGATPVTDPARYTILFNEDGTANIKADCNNVRATYTTDGENLSLTLGPSTLMACPPDSQSNEFMAGLQSLSMGAYMFDGADLVLRNLAADGGTMRFRDAGTAGAEAPAGEADTLTGVTWQWVKTVTPVDEIIAADPARYTILFNEDGTANIKADCNTGTAIYTTTADGAITITPGATTLAMCPEDSQATQFMAGLSAAALYFFQDGGLFIDQFAGSGTMQFRAAGSPDEPTTDSTGAPGKGQGGATAAPGDLTGATWQLNLITKPDGNITFNDPTQFTVTFNDDGTANVQAACNVGGMGYTAGEDGSLTMTPGPMTLAFCGVGSLDQVFLGGLTNAMSYRLEEGNLLIDMLYESGTMIFSPAG